MATADFCPNCGCVLRKSRSPKHHRFFFAAVQNAFDNWPEHHRFQPDNPEHLRAWLLVKAKYRRIINEPLDQDAISIEKMADFVEQAMKISREKYSFVAIHNGAIVILAPRSVDWTTLDEKEFQPISNAVIGVIEQETGIQVEIA
jgi:hypothetical protein